MRKKVYQEELEDDLSVQEKFKNGMNEKVSSLEAENQLLKKQVKYFQDLFASSSLTGLDPTNQSVSKKDLENFKKDLVNKIHPDLFKNEEPSLELIEEEQKDTDSLQNQTEQDSSKRDYDSTSSLRADFQLKRQSSSSSSYGYLFLAVVFCFMCCSSFLSPTTKAGLQTFKGNTAMHGR